MKKGCKFNVIDVSVILIVLIVIVFIGGKLFNGVGNESQLSEYEYVFLANEVPDFVIDYIKKGSEVHDGDNNSIFGEVIDFEVSESNVYQADSHGKIVESEKPDHSSVKLIVKGSGEQTKYGVKIDSGVYGVGHSLVLKLGNAKIECKISGIKEIKKIEE